MSDIIEKFLCQLDPDNEEHRKIIYAQCWDTKYDGILSEKKIYYEARKQIEEEKENWLNWLKSGETKWSVSYPKEWSYETMAKFDINTSIVRVECKLGSRNGTDINSFTVPGYKRYGENFNVKDFALCRCKFDDVKYIEWIEEKKVCLITPKKLDQRPKI